MVAFFVVAGICAVVGLVLYLPFFLWFRLSKRGQRVRTERRQMTPAGVLIAVLPTLVIGIGLFIHETDQAPELEALVHGDAIVVKWWAAMLVLLGLVEMLAVRRGVALDRPPTATTQGVAPAPAARPARLMRVVTLGGVPVYVHWSFLLAGLFYGMLAGRELDAWLGYCVGYAALFALHEAAHAVVARGLGVKVLAVHLTGTGGACLVQPPRRTRDAALIYSAGLAAQAAVLVATLAFLASAGRPESPFGAAVAIAFTWLNAALLLVNLIPRTTSTGGRTDGAVLWGLYRHVFHGGAHPLAKQLEASPVFDPSTRLLDIDGMKPDGFTAGIELLNDDTSPMELVVEMLERFGGLSREAAVTAMLKIHQTGGLLLPMPNLAVAELAADAITREARARGHALVCRAVSADA